MKKNLAKILALVLVAALLVPVAAFAASFDTYTVAVTIADKNDATKNHTVSADGIDATATLKNAIGAQVVGARNDLKDIFSPTGTGTYFDELVDAADNQDTWATYVGAVTVDPAEAAETLENPDATIDDLFAVSDKSSARDGKITITNDAYIVTLTFTVTTPYSDDPVSGGSSTTTTTYEDEIVAPENGTVEITSEDATVNAGDVVTIDAKPAEGYQVARYIVTDEQGNKVVVDAKDGTFVQPAGKVKVEVVFAPIGGDIVIESAQPSPQTLTVDGVQQDVHAYNVNGSNFVQLRDLAAMLAGTDAKFNVAYDAAKNMVVITTGEAYTGTVSSDFTDLSDTAVPSPQSIMIDGRMVELSAVNIGGNNYFKLRDLAPFFGLKVNYDEPSNTAQVLSK